MSCPGRPIKRLAIRVAAVAGVLAAAGLGADHQCVAAEVSFSRQIKPLLARRCFACHGPDADEAGLRLNRQETALADLPSGERAIVPGEPGHSALIARITAPEEDLRMPPEGKPLSDEQIGLLRQWIAEGARWEQHWAFVPPRRHEPPPVRQVSWPTNPIDAFVLARLERAGLRPAPRADREALVRRAYYGITGLPPTAEQQSEFLLDRRGDAWPRLVDRLLASPHYGEHWARHWLDAVRFAETNSFERDGDKPNAWKYRDYVIRSLNADKPYDRFIREQLAGDELDETSEETMTATGFYRLGIWDDEPADPLQAYHDELDDILTTTSKAFLGLTINCARCHDHKIDPIPQTDYYGMLAFFADVTSYGTREDQSGNNQWDLTSPELTAERSELKRRERTTRKLKTSLEEAGIKRMSAADQRRSETHERGDLLEEKLASVLSLGEQQQYQEVLAQLAAIHRQQAALPPPDEVLALARCTPRPPVTHVMQRGNPHAPAEPVVPHFPELFGDPVPSCPPAEEGARSAGRRRVLADWIASPENLLTARVIVNRVWHHHFGRGLVRSTSNFGVLGTPPTHPELLDWLALWLVEHDWQLKPLHRLILTSSTYRMSSRGSARGVAMDPNNDLFWRFDMRRLGAEELRDTVLLLTGALNRQVYGPSFFAEISPEALATQSRPGLGWGTSSAAERGRRSVYIKVKRSLVTPLLATFDFPETDVSCEARFQTTQPGQALSMINGKFLNDQAVLLAQRVARTAGPDPQDQIAEALTRVLRRAPQPDEMDEGLKLWERITTEHGLPDQEALRYWCLTLLNLNELMYLD
jgi:mono/diheme cytochrome c family protein